MAGNEIDTPATRAIAALGIDHRLVTIARVRSAEEAAAARGIRLEQLVKTLVVRRSEDDYLFVLVPGDREIDWAKLRAFLGERRLSMPSSDEALAVTGYERGTITPFGSTQPWPVIMDLRLSSVHELSIGSGSHGTAIHLSPDDLERSLTPTLADVTKPGETGLGQRS